LNTENDYSIDDSDKIYVGDTADVNDNEMILLNMMIMMIFMRIMTCFMVHWFL
jgi:hypothetical protein